ncbi:reprolysin-like metallopeptidase [Streptomyces purpureus]|uniref:InlB B-repeat-containing protein n=1 Tax=Streptomyces purpureus TaxID=1951 RepID=UPI0003A386BB|nr:M12 family metallo-peptidase [Streptomyces purpureus]
MPARRRAAMGAGLLTLLSLAAALSSPTPSAADGTAPDANRPWVLRSRTVQADPKEYAQLCARQQDGAPAERTVELFPDVQVTAVADRVDVDEHGTATFTGHVADRPAERVYITVTGACPRGRVAAGPAVDGLVTLGDRTYTLAPDPGQPGHVVITEQDPARRPAPVEHEIKERFTEGRAMSPRRTPSSDPVVIDMVVGWTPGAAARVGGEAGMRSRVALAEATLNRAFADSGIKASVDVVATYAPEYAGGERAAEVYRKLADPRDRRLGATAAALREKTAADLVAMLVRVPRGTSSGQGSLPMPPSSATDREAYSVTDVDSVVDWYNFGHEVGHNLGLWHDRATLDAQAGGVDYTPYLTTPYSTGWVTPNRRFHTLMAYSSACGQPCAAVNRYSNTVQPWEGQPLGDARSDNARVARATAPIVAAYREPATPRTRHALTLAVSPADGGTAAPSAWGPYRPGGQVTVTAVPSPGHRFTGWVLDGTRHAHTRPTMAVTMDRARTLTAVFEKA